MLPRQHSHPTTCQYPGGPCTYPTVPGQPFCRAHLCECGGPKRSQSAACEQCTLTRSGPNSPMGPPGTVAGPGGHPAAGSPTVPPGAVMGGGFGRPAGHGPTGSPTQHPGPLRNGSITQCKHMNKNGQHCLDAALPNSHWCQYHGCPVCGGEKGGAEPRCQMCMSGTHQSQHAQQTLNATPKCRYCGGALAPGFELCGNCASTDPSARANYITHASNKVQKQREPWLFIWDFDNTITRTHASDNYSGTLTNEIIAHDFIDVDFFRRVTSHLHSQGHYVKLASWANGPEAREVISRYLNYALGPNSRRAYMHDEGLEAWIPAACHLADHSKNTHIQNLMQQINAKGIKVNAQRVVLFDDNRRNIDEALKAGHNAVHCPQGFTQQTWQAFIQRFPRIPDFHSDDLYRSGRTHSGDKIRRNPSPSFMPLGAGAHRSPSPNPGTVTDPRGLTVAVPAPATQARRGSQSSHSPHSGPHLGHTHMVPVSPTGHTVVPQRVPASPTGLPHA